MNITLRLTAAAAVLGLAGGLYALRAPEEPGLAIAVAPAATGIAAPAMTSPGSPSTAVATRPVGDASATTVRTGDSALPLPTTEERATTRAARLEAMPAVLQAADAAIARTREELAALQRRAAPAAERQPLEEQLARMQAARAQLLARNADVSTVH